jgi:type II secretory pathway pseudopilin PulG
MNAQRGFSLIEAALATAIVGGLLCAVMNGVGGVARTSQRTAQHDQAALLAGGLMDEIAARAYVEPGSAVITLGREAGEAASDRSSWDDVDDYDGLCAPPSNSDGSTIDGFATGGWQWQVTVKYVDSSGVIATDSGLKLITVAVTRNGQALAKVLRVRTSAADAAAITSYQTKPTTTYSAVDSLGGS